LLADLLIYHTLTQNT